MLNPDVEWMFLDVGSVVKLFALEPCDSNDVPCTDAEMLALVRQIEMLPRHVLKMLLTGMCWQPGYRWNPESTDTPPAPNPHYSVYQLAGLVNALVQKLRPTTRSIMQLAARSAIANNEFCVRALLREISVEERNQIDVYAKEINTIVKSAAKNRWAGAVTMEFFADLRHERKFDELVVTIIEEFLTGGDISGMNFTLAEFSFQDSPLLPQVQKMVQEFTTNLYFSIHNSPMRPTIPSPPSAPVSLSCEDPAPSRAVIDVVTAMYRYDRVQTQKLESGASLNDPGKLSSANEEILLGALLAYVPGALRRIHSPRARQAPIDPKFAWQVAYAVAHTPFPGRQQHVAFLANRRAVCAHAEEDAQSRAEEIPGP